MNTFTVRDHKMTHLKPVFVVFPQGPSFWAPFCTARLVFGWISLIFLTRLKYASSTLLRVAALASRNRQLFFFANSCPWSVVTTRWCSKSHLLPTMMIGIFWPLGSSSSLTRYTSEWNVCSSSKLALSVIEYTHKKPCPCRMYWCRSELNSSCPAVSSISSMQVVPSMVTCFLYDSSMVGLYSLTNRLRTNCIDNALFPTPPAPKTTSLCSKAIIRCKTHNCGAHNFLRLVLLLLSRQ